MRRITLSLGIARPIPSRERTARTLPLSRPVSEKQPVPTGSSSPTMSDHLSRHRTTLECGCRRYRRPCATTEQAPRAGRTSITQSRTVGDSVTLEWLVLRRGSRTNVEQPGVAGATTIHDGDDCVGYHRIPIGKVGVNLVHRIARSAAFGKGMSRHRLPYSQQDPPASRPRPRRGAPDTTGRHRQSSSAGTARARHTR